MLNVNLDLLLPEGTLPKTSLEVETKLVATLAALGTPSASISERLQLPLNRVEAMLATPATADLVIRLQGSLFPDPRQRISRLGNVALDKITKILLTGNNKEAFAAAESLLDRSLGKAIQVTENRNLNVNVADPAAMNAALEAQQKRVKKLEELQAKLSNASLKPEPSRVKEIAETPAAAHVRLTTPPEYRPAPNPLDTLLGANRVSILEQITGRPLGVATPAK